MAQIRITPEELRNASDFLMQRLDAINNEVVAAHPNNSGMQVIADRIDQTVDTWLN